VLILIGLHVSPFRTTSFLRQPNTTGPRPASPTALETLVFQLLLVMIRLSLKCLAVTYFPRILLSKFIQILPCTTIVRSHLRRFSVLYF
jgi:hypothetical protein